MFDYNELFKKMFLTNIFHEEIITYVILITGCKTGFKGFDVKLFFS